jgi:hypothetical protein
MSAYLQDPDVTLHCGDALEVLRTSRATGAAESLCDRSRRIHCMNLLGRILRRKDELTILEDRYGIRYHDRSAEQFGTRAYSRLEIAQIERANMPRRRRGRSR